MWLRWGYRTLLSWCVLPLSSLLSSSKFWRLYKSFTDRGAAFYVSNQVDDLNKLLVHARDNTDFYKERFDSLNLPETDVDESLFQLIPPLRKQDILQNFPDRITSKHKLYSPWRYASTSGTLERMTVIHDFRKRDYIRASQLYAMHVATGYQPGNKYLEIPPDICTNVCGASDSVEPSLLSYIFLEMKQGTLFEKETISTIKGLIERQIVYRRRQLPSFIGNGYQQTVEATGEYLSVMDGYKPYIAKALPAYLMILASHIARGGDRPTGIHGLMPMGASLSKKMKDTIERQFGTGVYEDYGSAELGSIGAECKYRQGIHIFEGLFRLEVLKQGRPVKDGELGRVLITDLKNFAMPLIRYDIGDVAIVRNDPCPCGNQGLRIEVQGRLKDCLFDVDEQVISSDDITDFMLSIENVGAFQIEARNNRINLSVMPSVGDCNLSLIEKMLSEKLSGRYRIRSRQVQTIMPEQSGKYRFVKNFDVDIEKAL